MKIDLEYPFSEDWKSGYIVTNSENRKNVILYNTPKDRSTVSYARYLMSVKLKRYLTELEQVDHIDNDRTNDIISNLQILSVKENMVKFAKYFYGGRKYVLLKCPVCSGIFSRKANLTQMMQCFKNRIPCCSKLCRDEFNSIRTKFDSDFLNLLSSVQIISEYRK